MGVGYYGVDEDRAKAVGNYLMHYGRKGMKLEKEIFGEDTMYSPKGVVTPKQAVKSSSKNGKNFASKMFHSVEKAANDAKNLGENSVSKAAKDSDNLVGDKASKAVSGAAKDVGDWGSKQVDKGKKFLKSIFG